CVVLAPESQLWLAGLDSFISGVLPQALIVPADERRELVLVMWDADVPLGRATAVVEDIRSYRFGVDDPVAAFRAGLEACAPEARVVGFDAASRAVPHALGVALVEALAPARCVDCSTLLADARIVKSPAELACLRRAGAHANAGLAAALAHARPGIRAGLDAIRPGVEAWEVEAPALAILRAAGLGDAFKVRFAHGGGAGAPPTWLDPLQIPRTSTQRLAPGVSFVLHACLLDEAAATGVVVGGTYAVQEDAVEMLAGAGAVDLVEV